MNTNTLYKHPKNIRNELLEMNRKLNNTIIPSSPTVVRIIQSSSSPAVVSLSNNDISHAQEIINTSNINFGTIPRNYIFEELKCIVTKPAPLGTTLKVIDQYDNIVIKPEEIIVDQVGAFTWNGNKRISVDTILTGVFIGVTTGAVIEIVFIKKVWKII